MKINEEWINSDFNIERICEFLKLVAKECNCSYEDMLAYYRHFTVEDLDEKGLAFSKDCRNCKFRFYDVKKDWCGDSLSMHCEKFNRKDKCIKPLDVVCKGAKCPYKEIGESYENRTGIHEVDGNHRWNAPYTYKNDKKVFIK